MNADGKSFVEQGVLAGIAYSSTGEREGSMGLETGDFNRDGLLDIWYTNYSGQDNSLLGNVNNKGFVHASAAAGLTGVSRRWVGFGTLLKDFDGDGWEDIFVANGHVAYEALDSPYFQPAQLFKNRNGERFDDLNEQGGPYFVGSHPGRGAASVDFDNDGNLDVVVVHQSEPISVLRNVRDCKNWIRVNLVGTSSERTAIGAKVTIEQSGTKITSWRNGGGSYLSSSDSRLLFGLGSDADVVVTVSWLGGSSDIYSSLKPNHSFTIVQGGDAYVTP